MRAKIILPNLAAVLLAGLAAFFYLKHDLRSKAIDRLRERIEVTTELFDRSEQLSGYELLFDVRGRAMSKDITQAFAEVDVEPAEGESEAEVEKRIRRAWYQAAVRAVEMYAELWAEKEGKRPELVFLTDRKGVVIARNTTPNACPTGHNVAEAMHVVQRALDGEGAYAIWSVDDSPLARDASGEGKLCSLNNVGLLELAAAPVWIGDEIGGALVIGFEVSNGTAAKKKEQVGLEVAVLTQGSNVYSSSFTNDTARQSLDQQIKQVAAQKVAQAIQSGGRSDIFELMIEGEPYLGQVAPVRSAQAEDQIANLLMGSVDEASADAEALIVILVVMGGAAILVIIFGVILGGHFLRPVMAIEEGLLKVINGEYSYRFDVKSAEVGGLSYRINQLIGVLTGEEEEEGDDD